MCLLLLLPSFSSSLRKPLSPPDSGDPTLKTQAPVPHPAAAISQVAVLLQPLPVSLFTVSSGEAAEQKPLLDSLPVQLQDSATGST